MMRYIGSLLVLIALLSPVSSEEAPQPAASAKDAEQALQLYLDGVSKAGGRPDYTKLPASELFQRVFDIAKLSALPPPAAGDVTWPIEWSATANRATRLVMMFGAKSDLDEPAILRDLREYEDQFAMAMSFMVRVLARQGTALTLFMDQLSPEQRTPAREVGLQKTRRGAGELVASAVGSVAQGLKPANIRLLTGALRDTGNVWGTFILPDDRRSMVKMLAAIPATVTDGEARKDLATFAEALAAN
jgi:hypothetical protein